VRDFSYYSTLHDRWLAESGDFEILIGASSRDIRLQDTVTFNSTEQLNYNFTEFSYFYDFWHNPQLKPHLIELMPNWIQEMAGPDQAPEGAQIDDFLEQQPLIKYPYFTGGEVDHADIKAFVEKCNQLTYTP
jgi:beta-glucosidase